MKSVEVFNGNVFYLDSISFVFYFTAFSIR